MSKGTISINVSGNNSNIGNVVQGNNNIVRSERQYIDNKYDKNFDDFFYYLRDICSERANNGAEIDILRKEIETIQSSLKKTGDSEKNYLLKKAKILYENYSWAAKPLKQLFDVVFPGWFGS